MSIRSYFRKKWLGLYSKIVHEKASPEYIARGWAIGMFYGLFIPFGAQLVCSVPTAFLMKGSKIGAVFGTLVTNHFTIFFIYPFQCYLGNKCIGGDLSYNSICSAMNAVVQNQDWGTLLSMSGELIVSFFVGGGIFALIGTPITYFGVKRLVVSFREKRDSIMKKIRERKK